MKFIRKPIVIDAISFEDFIQHGRDSGAIINNGMPWSFTYLGRPVSHETDDHYLITLSSGATVHFTKDMMLVNDGINALYVLSKKDFDSVFLPAVGAPDPCGFVTTLNNGSIGFYKQLPYLDNAASCDAVYTNPINFIMTPDADASDLTRELFELLIKSARRCMYDLKHAADMVNDSYWRNVFRDSAEHYEKIFNSSADTKDYCSRLQNMVRKSEGDLAKAIALLDANKIDHNIRMPF